MMGWFINRKASASDKEAERSINLVQASAEEVRKARLDLEQAIRQMQEDRAHVGRG